MATRSIINEQIINANVVNILQYSYFKVINFDLEAIK
jgi:hypothetical protein